MNVSNIQSPFVIVIRKKKLRINYKYLVWNSIFICVIVIVTRQRQIQRQTQRQWQWQIPRLELHLYPCHCHCHKHLQPCCCYCLLAWSRLNWLKNPRDLHWKSKDLHILRATQDSSVACSYHKRLRGHLHPCPSGSGSPPLAKVIFYSRYWFP